MLASAFQSSKKPRTLNLEGRAHQIYSERKLAVQLAINWMRRTFFIVGPTATGKSELAADVAREIGAEIVSADAFQVYHGLDLLTAKPDASTLRKAPHHLIGTTPLHDEMNAEKYRRAASRAIEEIHSRGKLAIVVGGSGLYIKALTHGLAPLPESDPKLRERLNAMSLDELHNPTRRTRSRRGPKDRPEESPPRGSSSGDLFTRWETSIGSCSRGR
jgi:tRNA delta(2)-isopentenylpyrophosphate transferase